MSRLVDHMRIFDGITPWAGYVPQGYLIDFVGTKIDLKFRKLLGVDPTIEGGNHIQTKIPTLQTHGEGWFEVFNWVAAAREARESFVMMTLGACFGYQATGCFGALRILNPTRCKLVLVEPEPENMQWVRQHLRDNDIDPVQHWLVQMALSDTNEPVFFPVGSPGTGAQNCISVNLPKERRFLRESIIKSGKTKEVLSELLLRNSTGIMRDLIPGKNYMAEIKYVSSITLGDLLGPFSFVDYIEADMQMSELIVFPPIIDQLTQKVRRIHIGTHGTETHEILHKLFRDAGWEIVFSFEPNTTHNTSMGTFEANDGVLTVLNPRLART
jgi:hypothetical protein